MTDLSQPVLLFGIGTNAGRILTELSSRSLPDYVRTVQADTEESALQDVVADHTLQLGREWTDGLGCGGDDGQGYRAGQSSIKAIEEAVAKAKLVIVVTSLGRGTGSGAVMSVAQVIREKRLPALFLCVLPASIDGNRPVLMAERALQKLRAENNAVIVLPGNNVLSAAKLDEDFAKAYAQLNGFVADSVEGLVRMLNSNATKPIDFPVLRNYLMQRKAECGIGTATVSEHVGLDRILDQALACPLFGTDNNVTKVDAVIVSLQGDVSLRSAQTVIDSLHRRFPPSVQTDVGTQYDGSVPGQARLTLLAIRYQQLPKKRTRKPRKRSSIPIFDPTATRQMRLAIGVDGVGIFSQVQATVHHEQNLDVPTFQRQGIELDLAETE